MVIISRSDVIYQVLRVIIHNFFLRKKKTHLISWKVKNDLFKVKPQMYPIYLANCGCPPRKIIHPSRYQLMVYLLNTRNAQALSSFRNDSITRKKDAT